MFTAQPLCERLCVPPEEAQKKVTWLYQPADRAVIQKQWTASQMSKKQNDNNKIDFNANFKYFFYVLCIFFMYSFYIHNYKEKLKLIIIIIFVCRVFQSGPTSTD